MRNAYLHYLFYDRSEAEDFFEAADAEYLMNLERYSIYTRWEAHAATKKEPFVGYNVIPMEYSLAKTYSTFLAYERSPMPFDIFGSKKILAENKPTFIKKLIPLKLSKHQ